MAPALHHLPVASEIGTLLVDSDRFYSNFIQFSCRLVDYDWKNACLRRFKHVQTKTTWAAAHMSRIQSGVTPTHRVFYHGAWRLGFLQWGIKVVTMAFNTQIGSDIHDLGVPQPYIGHLHGTIFRWIPFINGHFRNRNWRYLLNSRPISWNIPARYGLIWDSRNSILGSWNSYWISGSRTFAESSPWGHGTDSNAAPNFAGLSKVGSGQAVPWFSEA